MPTENPIRYNNLDLNLLVALNALFTEGSVTKAAEKLHLSQSAMSNALGRLRDFFEDELFVPAGRGLRPTPFAQELSDSVRQLLGDVQSKIIDRSPFDPSLSRRTFSIAASDYMIQVYLSDLSAYIGQIAPYVGFEITPLTSESVRQKLALGEVDFLLCPETVRVAGYPSIDLFTDDFVLVACAHNPDIGASITVDEFTAADHVVIRLGPNKIAGLDEHVVQNAGLTRKIGVSVGTFDHVAPFVAGTRRLAMMQRGMAQYCVEFIPLKILELPFENQSITESLQWQRHNLNSPAHIWMKDVMVRRIKEKFSSLSRG